MTNQTLKAIYGKANNQKAVRNPDLLHQDSKTRRSIPKGARNHGLNTKNSAEQAINTRAYRAQSELGSYYLQEDSNMSAVAPT